VSRAHAAVEAVVGEIINVLLPGYPVLDTAGRAAVEGDVTRYVASQIESMPGFLRLPYKLALFGFELLPLLRRGKRFGRLRDADRARYLAFWNDAPLAPMRDFVKLIRSSALLVYFDHPAVMQCLERERRDNRSSHHEGHEGHSA
jgi:hypothetical protein